MKEYLAQIKQNLLFPKVILRFHALRRLTATMTADIVPFTLEIHKRCQEAHLTYIAMERLSFNRGHRTPEQVGHRATGAKLPRRSEQPH